MHIYPRPAAKSRPSEITYAVHCELMGDALPKERFLASEMELGPPVSATLSASFYGKLLGGGSVPVLLHASKRLLRRVELAKINCQMSAEMRAVRDAVGSTLTPLAGGDTLTRKPSRPYPLAREADA